MRLACAFTRPLGGAVLALALSGIVAVTGRADAQDEPATRAATVAQAQAEKAAETHAYIPNRAEKILDRIEQAAYRGRGVHTYFDSAYSGGGFTVGAGYLRHISPYNTLDVRGSITPSGYKRIEGELIMPRLMQRRAALSLVGGWREATEVGFYGFGTANAASDRANYGFKQPYGIATLNARPWRSLAFRGGFEASEWAQGPGAGDAPSVDTVYAPGTLPGLGATVTYLHSQIMAGVDTRPSPGYARRGGMYGVTVHEFSDPGESFGFTQWDYEALQHVPILRDTWVLSLHGRARTTSVKSDEEIPFFMLPAIGGGSSLRGFSSWRFRDRNSLEMQAEWRLILNRFLDMAVFFDAGKVAAHARDLNLDGLKTDAGIGFRFHGPLATPLRIEFAKGNEGLSLVFAAAAAF